MSNPYAVNAFDAKRAGLKRAADDTPSSATAVSPRRTSPRRPSGASQKSQAGSLMAFFSGKAKAAKRPRTAAPTEKDQSAGAATAVAAATPAAAGAVFGTADLHASWHVALAPEFDKAYFKGLQRFLAGEYGKHTIFPPREQVFSWSALCPFDSVKVVVIGQDPYHGPGQAHGLAFSVQRGVQTPPSLRNMLAEAHEDVGTRKKPPHGNLEAWARQGVLLLNTCLTVRKGAANSHQKRGWEQFTDAVIRAIGRRREGVVFLLWGKPAATKGGCIDRKKHHILMSSHPSPLAYTKTNAPFKGSRVFSKTNALLESMGKGAINWAI